MHAARLRHALDRAARPCVLHATRHRLCPSIASASPSSLGRAWAGARRFGRTALLLGGAAYVGAGLYAVSRQYATFLEVSPLGLGLPWGFACRTATARVPAAARPAPAEPPRPRRARAPACGTKPPRPRPNQSGPPDSAPPLCSPLARAQYVTLCFFVTLCLFSVCDPLPPPPLALAQYVTLPESFYLELDFEGASLTERARSDPLALLGGGPPQMELAKALQARAAFGLGVLGFCVRGSGTWSPLAGPAGGNRLPARAAAKAARSRPPRGPLAQCALPL
jgi:hypothetical protein